MFRRLAVSLTLALVLSLAATPGLLAALAFESAELTLAPKPGEEEIRGGFRFKNTGDAPVRITKVHSGCLCTVPETPAEAVAPGAEGSLPILYKPGQRTGRQETVLHVETSDGARHALRLVVDLPVRVSFAPRLLLFRGGERESRTATITFPGDSQTELLGVTVAGAEFEIVGRPALEQGTLKLELRFAGDAAATARATARIRTRDSAGAEHTDVLYLRHTP